MRNSPFVVEPFGFEEEGTALTKSEVGLKAQGLLRLPKAWQPRFFILAASVTSALRDGLEENTFSSFAGPELIDSLLAAVYRISSPGDLLCLRSSAAGEGIDERGAYESSVCQPEWPSIAHSLRDVMAASLEVDALCPIAVIIQRFVSIKRASGHLSNERRVSRRKTTWLCEIDVISGVGSAGFERWSSIGVETLDEDEPITCHSQQELFDKLRSLGAWASRSSDRLHFEWIWDGSFVWVVQGDRVPEERGAPPGSAVTMLRSPRSRPEFNVLKPEVEVEDHGWQKLSCLRKFRQCGLPTPNIWILNGEELLNDLRLGRMPSALEEDLRAILALPTVIRMDLGRGGDQQYLLPRSECLTSLGAARDFLFAAASVINEAALASAAFFLHWFIPSRSSAYSMAEPTSLRVRVDGLWGLPDGLLFYSHDSFELNAEGGPVINRRVRFKDEYLDAMQDGSWRARRAGVPWDWRNSLEDEELRFIADGSWRVAQKVGAAVQIMWFVGIPEATGHARILPWYFDVEQPPRGLHSRRKGLLDSDSFLVKRWEDLSELKRGVPIDRNVRFLRIRPIPELLRNQDFLVETALVAKSLGVPLELDGSILSHAYYILRRSDVPMLTSDPFEPEEDRKTFGKLVRDRIPDKISQHGEVAVTVKLSAKALSSALKAKILEEAFELFWSEDREELKEEVVDVRTVVDALVRHEGMENEELQHRYDAKVSSRGGFSEGIVLKETIERSLGGEDLSGQDLFLVDAPGSSVVQASASGADITPLPRFEGHHLLAVPLIPPDLDQRHLSHVFRLPALGVAISVRYREKEILLEISRIEENPKEPASLQLSLFSSS